MWLKLGVVCVPGNTCVDRATENSSTHWGNYQAYLEYWDQKDEAREIDKGQSMKGIIWHTEEFHIYPVGTEGH